MATKPIINGIRVDLSALQAIRHNCRPEICKNQPSCCFRYVPHVQPAKMETIVGCLPTVANYTDNIIDNDAFINVFDECEDGSYRIDANEDEDCIFTYMLRSGEKLCSLHSAAIDLLLSPVSIKPSACSLWPLILLDGATPELSVDKNWKAFPCNRESNDPDHLDPGVVSIITSYFGKHFLDKLLEYSGR
jgi:hypothetical protein